MNQQPRWPQVVSQSSLDRSDLFSRGRNDHQPKLARSHERQELLNTAAFRQIRRTLASNVIRRSAQIHTHQFQHIRFINAVRCRSERPAAAMDSGV